MKRTLAVVCLLLGLILIVTAIRALPAPLATPQAQCRGSIAPMLCRFLTGLGGAAPAAPGPVPDMTPADMGPPDLDSDSALDGLDRGPKAIAAPCFSTRAEGGSHV